MPRPEKVQAVAEIKERIEGAQAVFLAEYAGLSVKDQQQLRRALRASGAEFKVVKMTLARRATDALDIESLDELLLGPTGMAFADEDPVGAAKVLKDFAKAHDVFTVKGGLLGAEYLSPERISELAEIEPREVLLAKLAGAMKAPMANLAGLLAALPRNTASVLQQLLEKKEAEAPAVASEAAPAADESVTEEEADAAPEAETDDAAPEPDAQAPTDDVDAGADDDAGTETEDDSDATVEAAAEATDDDTEDDDTEDEPVEASDDAEEK